MADRIRSDYTTRKAASGYVEAPDLTITVVSDSLNTNKVAPYILGFEPLEHKMTRGISPSVWSFRAAVSVTSAGERSQLDPVSILDSIDIYRPSEAANQVHTEMYGFSDGALSPMVQSETDALEQAETIALPSSMAYVKIWEELRSGDTYLGKFYLSNMVAAGMDGTTLVFSDARYLNTFRQVAGVHHLIRIGNENQGTLAYAPFETTVFNRGGCGNKSTGGANSPSLASQYAFDFEWANIPADLSSTKFWTLWDMLRYLWAHGYVLDIEEPSLNDADWLLWSNHGGTQSPEIDITNMTVVEAIDKIITAAGEYSWTLVPSDESSGWRLRVFEYRRWSSYSSADSGNATDAMPSRRFLLSANNADIASTECNTVSCVIDENTSERIGRLLVCGKPILVESTFSTDGSYDYSAVSYGSAVASGVQTLYFTGDTSAWRTAYRAASSSLSHLDRCRAASAVVDGAYQIVGLNDGSYRLTSGGNGIQFFPSDRSWALKRRPFLPYRLPKPASGSTDAAAKSEKPSVLVWLKKPSATTWKLAQKMGRRVGGYQVDPVANGIRFGECLVEYDSTSDTFTEWEVMVTAVVELDEPIHCEVYRDNYDHKWAIKRAQTDYQYAIRWNAVQDDGTTLLNGEVINELSLMEDFAEKEFAKYDRFKVSGAFDVPWVERIYAVGDFALYLQVGSSSTSSSQAVANRELNAPIVGVEIDYQSLSTTVRTENWRQ